MNPNYSPEVLSLLSAWAARPDAHSDLREIFRTESEEGLSLLSRIKKGDLSWLPGIEILSAAILSPAIAAYAKETSTIYLSDACPGELITEALLEEIGHHIDALLNTGETPGDEGALFSATVRGITLTDEELASILNEDDSATIIHRGSLLSVECASSLVKVATLPPAPPAPPANDTITTAVSTILPATSHGLVGTGLASISLTGNSPSAPLAYNYLQANGGNDTLIAGNATTTSMVGGAGNDWFLGGSGTQTDYFKGGTGNSTMVASNGAATLIGGSSTAAVTNNGFNNSLVAGSGNQSLIGGAGRNFLKGGIGKDTLRSGSGSNTLVSGTTSTLQGNTLIGGGASNSLVAGSGNDSLIALSGASTLLGGTGKDTLLGGTGSNFLNSGSSSSGGNTLLGGSGPNTLVAGLGKDSLLGSSSTNSLSAGADAGAVTIVGGTGNNTLVSGSLAGGESLVGGKGSNFFAINSQAQANQFGSDTISFSSLSSASLNTLGIISSSPVSIQDSLFAHVAPGYLTAVVDKNGTTADSIIIGAKAQASGVVSLVSGAASDTLSTAGFTSSAVLNGSAAVSRVSLVGATAAGALGDTFLGSQNGYDVMRGSSGNDLFILQNTTGTSTISGDGGTDTLQINRNAALNYQTFNAITGVSVLSLSGGTAASSGVNSIGSLQGSGITTIIGGGGVDSDVISASVSALVKSSTLSNSNTLTLALQSGASGTMGFASGQYLSGNGISPGTMITNTLAGTGTITIQLSKPTSALIAQGTLINAYLNGITIDGSVSGGQNATPAEGAAALQEVISLSNASNGIYQTNIGLPDELNLDVQALKAQRSNPLTYIQKQGDSLVVGGTGELVEGAISTTPDSLLSSAITFTDSYGNKVTGIQFYSHVVADNTFVSGMFNNSGPASLEGAQNTLVGGPGNNTYILNNLVGDTLLPTLENPQYVTVVGGVQETIQSGSTIQFTGNAVKLTDASFANVGAGTAQIIRTANGNNLIALGQYGAQVGIQTIIGGLGADTFVTIPTLDGNGNTIPYQQSIFIDGSRGNGNQSLVSGSGNDTLLGGNGNATLQGGDGNNSLIGGIGNNIIQSGVGNSTLDGGLGSSTMQAAGGTNLFIVRNRQDVILNADDTSIPNPYSLEAGTAAEISNVDSYVNFDPLQSSEVDQFDPSQPDGSPSITKSQSFASSDLSAFYNIANFTLDGGASYGGATYGVGNALDNDITTTGTLSHLVLGMGGNNTIVGSGTGDSLYGYVNSTYANPDLYAESAVNTIDQEFVDGVIGTAGNNSIVANGAHSYLDGGPGYNDGLGDSSGSNTLVGNAAGDTFVVHNQGDSIVAATGNNVLVSTVDLHAIANNITDVTLLVTTQAPDLPNIDPNNPTLPSNTGQIDPANFLGFGNGVPNSTESHSVIDSDLVISLAGSTQLDVQYGTANGQQYENDDGITPSSTGYNGQPMASLSVGPESPDPNHPGSVEYTLTWSSPTLGGQVTGYDVYYRTDYGLVNGNESLGPWLTYVDGTSTDMQGTSSNPSVIVDNLPTLATGQNYDFRVTAQQLTMPVTTDPNTGLVSATPVTLQGSNGNDMLRAFMPAESLFGGNPVDYNNNAADLSNKFGSVPIPNVPAGNQPTLGGDDNFPVSMDGGNGNNVMDTKAVGYGDGSDYVVGGVTYGGLDSMQGDIGSDTFFVSNGGNGSNFDNVLKYGNETPVDYTNYAPGAPKGNDGNVAISTAGVSLNGGEHNLIVANHISQPVASVMDAVSLGATTITIQSHYGDTLNNPANGFYVGEQLEFKNTPFSYGGYVTGISYDGSGDAILSLSSPVTETLAAGDNIQGVSGVTLSSTVVDQGEFIDELCLDGVTNFVEGNALNDFIYDVNTNGVGGNTLVGNLGQDSIIGTGPGDVLIGGNATGLDSIAGALADAYAGLSSSIYRNTDPNPNNPGGPGAADPSQYWTLNAHLGGYVYNYDANSDTLVADTGTLTGAGETLCSGAGADSMVGSIGNDYFVVSSGGTVNEKFVNEKFGGLSNITDDTLIGYGDGYAPTTNQGLLNDQVIGNGGDDTVMFTGSDVYWSGLDGATTATLGYALNGGSISNVVLQMGDPVALAAAGNNSSTGVSGQEGSNMLVGNEYNNTLDGLGVGSNGGVDTLVGNGGTDYFNVPSSAYESATADSSATGVSPTTSNTLTPTFGLAVASNFTAFATDEDWAVIKDFTAGLQINDTLSGDGIAQGSTVVGSTLLPGTNGEYQVSLSNPTTSAISGDTIITDSLASPKTTLESNYASGTTVIQVADNSSFSVGESITLASASIPADTQGTSIAGMNLTSNVLFGNTTDNDVQIGSTQGFAIGDTVTGSGIAAGTTITGIRNDTLIGGGASLNVIMGSTLTGNANYATLSGSAISAFSLDSGMQISGNAIPGGTDIISFSGTGPSSSMTLEANTNFYNSIPTRNNPIAVDNILTLSQSPTTLLSGSGYISLPDSIILSSGLNHAYTLGDSITGAVTQKQTVAPIAGTPSSPQVGSGSTEITLGGNGSDVLQLPGGAGVYLIGSAPNGFGANNMSGGNLTGTDLTGNPSTDATSTDFGIYLYNPQGSAAPNLVAQVEGISMSTFLAGFDGGVPQIYAIQAGTSAITTSGSNLYPNLPTLRGGGTSYIPVNGQSTDPTNPYSYGLGGLISNVPTNSPSQVLQAEKNFLGMGAFYEMPTSNTTHISYPTGML